MDEKLARGFTREMFRRLIKEGRLETNPTTPAVAGILRRYLDDGGTTDTNLAALASSLETVLTRHGDAVGTQHIHHPIKRKVIVEATSPAGVQGAEQNWLIAKANTWVFDRNVLKLVETVHHVAIAEHAVFRIFQRGDVNSGFANKLVERATLWAPALLFILFGRGAKAQAPVGTEVAIPFEDGLLLGTTEVNYLEGPEQGPTITDFRRGGHRMRRLGAPFRIDGNAILTIGINTYVGRHELFDNQRAILDELETFAKRYGSSMARMRRICALGYPDSEVSKLLGPVPFSEVDSNAMADLAGQTRAFFETPEWRRHAEAHRPRVRYLQ